jgi:predicted transcriptional regulator
LDLNETLKNTDIIKLFLAEPFMPLATSEIERRLGLSHHPTFRRLKILEKNQVLIKKDTGYALNLQNEAVSEIMRFITNMEKIQAAIKKCKK